MCAAALGAICIAIRRYWRQKDRELAIGSCKANITKARQTLKERTSDETSEVRRPDGTVAIVIREEDLAPIRAIGGTLRGVRACMNEHGLSEEDLGLKTGSLDRLDDRVRVLTKGVVITDRTLALPVGPTPSPKPRRLPAPRKKGGKELHALLRRWRADAEGRQAPPAPTSARGRIRSAIVNHREGTAPPDRRKLPVPTSLGTARVPLPPRNPEAASPAALHSVTASPSSTATTQPSMVPPPGSDRRHQKTPYVPVTRTTGVYELPDLEDGELDRLLSEASEPLAEGSPELDLVLTEQFIEENARTVRMPTTTSSGATSKRPIDDEPDEVPTVALALDFRRRHIGPVPPDHGDRSTSLTGEFTLSDVDVASDSDEPGVLASVSQEIEAMFRTQFGEFTEQDLTRSATGS